MTQDIYWELLIWLFRSFMGVTAFAFTVAAYQAMRCRRRRDPQTEKVRAGCAEKPYFLRESSGIICGIELRGHFPYLPEMSSSLPDEAFLSRMCHEELWRLFPIILSGSREEWAELYRRERDLLAEACGLAPASPAFPISAVRRCPAWTLSLPLTF